ncbi:unnamed protein product [Adineta ricciae]|uniref:G-protein coupled receptors family 1 profile domain-containing protein n=1 Tax=Adineta ricciae TaxID=249248 RepID=A0A815FV68_ADIRI|nr:unnamed protein product [Adineta ricciae]
MGNVPAFCQNVTLTQNNTSYEVLSQCWPEKRIADALRLCLPLIILPISLINNSLSYFALRSRQMRGTSTAFFMLILSILDPLVLLTKNLVYFPVFIPANTISCKILYFLIYVLGYTNVWLLVIMTIDKFFAVWFPLKASYFCTISRAKCTFDLSKRASVLTSSSNDVEMRCNQKRDVIRSRHRHITLMLLSVAALFLLLTLPNSIYFVLDVTYGFNKAPVVNDYHQWLRYRRLTILTIIMFQLSDLQHAVNFYLYLLTSHKFRRAVSRICLIFLNLLPTFLTCTCHEKLTEIRYIYKNLDKNQYSLSCRSSVYGTLNSAQSSRHMSQQMKSLYVYHGSVSKSTTAVINDMI